MLTHTEVVSNGLKLELRQCETEAQAFNYLCHWERKETHQKKTRGGDKSKEEDKDTHKAGKRTENKPKNSLTP